ncbi:MAG: FIST N-terminal domain-containing protein [Polyangiaceae bacterium]
MGRSVLVDADAAAREAWRSANKDDSAPRLVLVFATSCYDHHRLLQTLAELSQGATVVGCSVEGVITRAGSEEGNYALGLMLVWSETLRFDPFVVPEYASDSEGAGRRMGGAVHELLQKDGVALLTFLDGLTGDATAFLRGLTTLLPLDLPVVGGVAADALRLDTTYQFFKTEVLTGAAVGLLISGQGTARVAIGHGCTAIGRVRTVTRWEAGWVLEIDHKPAWEVFRAYLDGDPQDLKADGIMHLSVDLLPSASENGESLSIVRTPMLLRKGDGALFFPGGGVALGSRLRIVRRDPMSLRDSAVRAAEQLRRASPAKPDMVLQFDCAGRGKVVFGASTTEAIIAPLQQIVGGDIPWLGFHTYGEIAPTDGHPQYHNYTVVLVAVYPLAG